ncbi:MAG: hypothetical protein VKL42_12525 [Snowella sp.]|nr:hypothetical protein [Snowella sp.]
MLQNVILNNGFAFRIPSTPSRYRANCSRDFGCFVTGETKNMNILQVTEAGLAMGNFTEMAICWIDQRTLTFKPHYENEQFMEIWGIPTAGKMQEQFGSKCSELSTFLIHRQSKDKMSGLTETASRDAFVKWVEEGMNGDPETYALNKMQEFYLSGIFRFEFVQKEGDYGVYYFVQVSRKEATTDLELAAIQTAAKINQRQLDGEGICTDLRLVDNEIQCLQATTEIKEVEVEIAKTGKRQKAIAGK